MTELQLKIWEIATRGGEPQHRASFVTGEVVEAMGFTWDGEPIGTVKPKPAPAPEPEPAAEVVAEAPAPVEVHLEPSPEPVAVEPQPVEPEAVEADPVEPEPEAPAPEPVAEEPDPTPDDPNPKPDATPVEELGLTAGVVGALKAAGINTAGEARAAETADTLRSFPGIGPAKLAAIRAALQ